MNKAVLSSLLNPSVFVSVATIIVAIAAYVPLYGWRFATGFIALIFCHEMGHFLAAKQKKLHVGLPMFIPFVGAWVEMKSQPVNAEVEAYVAYAGPFIGSLAAFAVYFWGMEHHSSLAMALAYSGFLLNLLNLIPLSPLDGGRIASIVSPRIWLLGLPILVLLFLRSPNPMIVVIAVLAFPQVKRAWYYNPHAPQNLRYYAVSRRTKIIYMALYLGLAGVLAFMLYSMRR